MLLIGAVDEELLELEGRGCSALPPLTLLLLLLLPAGPRTAPQPRRPQFVLQEEPKGLKEEVQEGGSRSRIPRGISQVIQQPCPTSGQKGKGEVGRVNQTHSSGLAGTDFCPAFLPEVTLPPALSRGETGEGAEFL